MTEVAHRFYARAAWFCAARDMIGLYLQTDAGRVFVQIPLRIWIDTMRADKDHNGNPLPKQRTDEIFAQLKRDAEASSVQVVGAEYSSAKRERNGKITPERRHQIRELWLRWKNAGRPYGSLKLLSSESGEPYQTLRTHFKFFDATEVAHT